MNNDVEYFAATLIKTMKREGVTFAVEGAKEKDGFAATLNVLDIFKDWVEYVGTDGEHQDEFLRGDRPKDLLRNSILTPSLGAAIMNAKYVNSLPLYRIEEEFSRNGVNISRQVMAGWIIRCCEKYLAPMYDCLKERLLEYPVTQSDETPVEVIRDGRGAGSTSYMCYALSFWERPKSSRMLYFSHLSQKLMT